MKGETKGITQRFVVGLGGVRGLLKRVRGRWGGGEEERQGGEEGKCALQLK